MDLKSKRVERFLIGGKPKLLRLAVLSPGRGRPAPRVSSVWYLWRDGYFWITTSEDRLKVAAIRSNRNVALIVDTDMTPYRGVIVQGHATLTKLNLEEITLAIVKRYVPKEDVDEEYKDLMKYPRVLVKIRPIKAVDIMSYRTH